MSMLWFYGVFSNIYIYREREIEEERERDRERDREIERKENQNVREKAHTSLLYFLRKQLPFSP